MRDALVLGLGAVLAVATLMLPLDLFSRLGAGVAVGGLFLVLSALRVGRDRLTPEEWLVRRLRFRPTRYAHYVEEAPRPAPETPPAEPRPEPAPQPEPEAAPAPVALEPGYLYRAVLVGLVMVGALFVRWLADGGAADVAGLLRELVQAGGGRPWGR